MSHVLLPSTLVLALFAVPARSQSFNVDFEPVPNPYGALPSTYGAAAHSPGTWNSVSSVLPTNLLGLNGQATSVVFSSPHSTAGFNVYDFSQSAGSLEALFDDFWGIEGFYSPLTASFTNLAPGEYEVYTICCSPYVGDGLWVQVAGSPDGTRHNWADAVTGYWEGENYALHHKTVTDGTLDITVNTGGHAPNDNVISGLQIVRLEDPIGLSMCFGDGTAATCPCSNAGISGHGCDNSVGTGGAVLVATGRLEPDTIVLQSSGELPNALTIFLQGNASIAPVIYGDGLRCVGGPFVRLYVKSASGGVASAPGAGDPSITARAAAVGRPIQPGDERYYQAYYRDPDASFCPSPPGATFNASQALKITW